MQESELNNEKPASSDKVEATNLMQQPEKEFVKIYGNWNFEGTKVTYKGPIKVDTPETNWNGSDGICLSQQRCHSGEISVQATIRDARAAARLVFGYRAKEHTCYSIGINGWCMAYVLARHASNGVQPIKFAGGHSNILSAGEYNIKVIINGQDVSLFINKIPVLEHVLPEPIGVGQVGLYVWGLSEDMVAFDNLVVRAKKPSAFVVMRFQEPFNTIYEKIIQNIADKCGFDAHRADDVNKPGAVLDDIIKGIIESDVVVVDISPELENENVFYELGYAHAKGKPTILLAKKGRNLPFDINGQRVIFYSDTIGGRSELESLLSKHFESIKNQADHN